MKTPGPKVTRWDVAKLGWLPKAQAKPTRWRSRDLKGPLPAHIVRSLEAVISSLPLPGSWAEIDEESWWADVLTDARARTPSEKNIQLESRCANLRLDRSPAQSLTFTCHRCGANVTLKLDELNRAFGRDRNVHTIGREVLKCPEKRARREGYECPVTYRA
jgi:hypothetical protein